MALTEPFLANRKDGQSCRLVINLNCKVRWYLPRIRRFGRHLRCWYWNFYLSVTLHYLLAISLLFNHWDIQKLVNKHWFKCIISLGVRICLRLAYIAPHSKLQLQNRLAFFLDGWSQHDSILVMTCSVKWIYISRTFQRIS